MIFIAGTRLAGRIEDCNGTHVVTTFGHVFGLPLFPIQTYLRIPLEGGIEHAWVPIDRVASSVLAAYQRNWGIGSVVFGSLMLASGNLFGAAFIAAGIGLAWVGQRVGVLAPSDKARFQVYELDTGYAADPVHLPADVRAKITEKTAAEIHEQSNTVRRDDYRSAGPINAIEVASHLERAPKALLQTVLTHARIQTVDGPQELRVRYAASHDTIWKHLSEPDHVEAKR